MPIIVAFLIISLAIIAITYKTYVGYGSYRWYTKLGFFLFLVLGLYGPIVCFIISRSFPELNLAILMKILYFIFGFIIYLFVLTFLRDILWMIIDVVKRTPLEDMKNPPYLHKANIITICCCLLFCLYGFYEAEKIPQVLNYEIVSPKIKEKTKVAVISDLHFDRGSSVKYIKKLVEKVNDLHPDVIVLLGDIVDDKPFYLYKQMEALKELKAKYGTYIVTGNHEYYVNALDWAFKFGEFGFEFLSNYGVNINDTGIYLAGVPDINSSINMGTKIKVSNALYFAKPDDYVIMLSHTPKIAEGITKDNVDLQLSAHTHGGQIFPFHYFAKQSNEGRLAGFYDVNGIKMYITRGTRYWGPPLRIGAPSEITVFNFIPEKNDK